MTLNLSLLDLLVLSLACWRLAYLATKEAAPFQIMAKIRAKTTLGGLLSCLYCSSAWAALVVALLWLSPLQVVVWILAISGAALMLASYTGVNHPQ